MEVRPGYKQTEVGIIPEGWEVCPVAQKGQVVTGKALAVNAPGPQRPYLRTKNVFDGRIDIDDVLTMPMTDEQFSQFRIRNGDVLLNEGQSIELVGRCAMYQDEYPEPCAIQNALLRFRARTGVSAKFASYLFRRCQHTGVFARIALQTTSVAHLGGSRFEKLRLAWPTEPEQCAIAEALGDVDVLLNGLERLISKKRDLKQAAMQQLLTGQTRLPGFHGEWEVKRLGDVVQIKKGQLITSSTLVPGDIPVIAGGKQPAYFHTTANRFGRTVTISASGASAGYVALYNEPIFASDCSTISESDAYSLDFVFYQLLNKQHTIYKAQTGGAQPHIHPKDLNPILFSFPSPKEQTAIASVLTDMDAELEALEQRRNKTRALKQGMMQELLTGRTRLV
jgi:type I restriction enzyme S subunit